MSARSMSPPAPFAERQWPRRSTHPGMGRLDALASAPVVKGYPRFSRSWPWGARPGDHRLISSASNLRLPEVRRGGLRICARWYSMARPAHVLAARVGTSVRSVRFATDRLGDVEGPWRRSWDSTGG